MFYVSGSFYVSGLFYVSDILVVIFVSYLFYVSDLWYMWWTCVICIGAIVVFVNYICIIITACNVPILWYIFVIFVSKKEITGTKKIWSLFRVHKPSHLAKWPYRACIKPTLRSAKALALGKDLNFVECRTPVSRQSLNLCRVPSARHRRPTWPFCRVSFGSRQNLCRVPEKRHSAKPPSPSRGLPSVTLGKAFAECIPAFCRVYLALGKCQVLVVFRSLPCKRKVKV